MGTGSFLSSQRSGWSGVVRTAYFPRKDSTPSTSIRITGTYEALRGLRPAREHRLSRFCAVRHRTLLNGSGILSAPFWNVVSLRRTTGREQCVHLLAVSHPIHLQL